MGGPINFTPIVTGAARDAATVNAMFTSIATVSAALNASNILEEGLLWSNLATDVARVRETPIKGTGAAWVDTNDPGTGTGIAGGWKTIIVGGTTMQTGAITVASNELMLVQAAGHFAIDTGGPTYGFALGHRGEVCIGTDVGGGYVADSDSIWRRGDVNPAIKVANGWFGPFYTETLLNPGAYTRICILARNTPAPGATYRITPAILVCTRFKRVT